MHSFFLEPRPVYAAVLYMNLYSSVICIFDFQGIPYEINEDIEVVATPGHTATDVSVLVRNTSNGIVAVTGEFSIIVIHLC